MLTTEGSTRSTTGVNPEVNDTWSLTAALAVDNKILTPCELRRPVIHNPATPPIPRASSRIIAAIGRRTSIHPLFFVGVVSFIPPPVSAPPARPRRWAVLGQRPLPCGRLPKRSPQDRFLRVRESPRESSRPPAQESGRPQSPPSPRAKRASTP